MTAPAASRHNDGKLPVHDVLRFDAALDAVAAVMAQGRIKYPDTTPGQPNWTLGGNSDDSYLSAAARHFKKHMAGEVYDLELGTQHLAHTIWNLMAYITLNAHHLPTVNPDFDRAAFEEKYHG